ncbi:MAG: hypothetical protein NUW01_01290 [Gemmatimonadaceae bacterium]|nr:hypothetical protein [Gemmatimonadaceae bacterium]
MSGFSLADLITRCRLAYERMGTKNPHRELIQECAVVMHTMAVRLAALEREAADKPRIILPG